MTTDDSNNPDSHDTPSDHDEPISATPDNINSKISEEEKEISLDGFGSASITSTSPDEDDDEDVNAYYRDQIIARENEKYTPANTGSQGNGNGHENANRQRSELEFELTLKLKQAGIVKRFAYYAKTNAIQVLLSHHYDNKSIVFSVYKKDWNKTHSIFEKQLKQKGVSKEHILQFLDVLDSNYDAILGLCSLDSQSTGSYSDDSDDKIQQQNTPAIIAAAEAFLAEDENEEQVKEEEAIIIDPSKDLDPYILDQDRDYAENVIKTAKKTVKQEDALVRQIVYTGLSAYTNDPINLGIIAPTSEGKTYPVIECMNLFPKDDKWLIGKMSTKMLVRQKGVLVDENNEPLKPKIKDIKYQIKQAEQDGDTEHVQDLRDQLAALYERSRTLIN